ncbi:conserved hypothetical protein [Sphingomonas aurantiaca]|uniref:Uncharacterized protein n=1 Tax=Sphingomonas aurantiaca TaxID=185949 RepID=A0A5E8AS09_9SPHN|nr:conserved hypothetical protein [Sphingomonas aurantiaca]
MPLFIVLVFELIDEAFDFTRYYVDRYTREPGPTLVDTALITLSPLVIVLGSGPIDVMAAI